MMGTARDLRRLSPSVARIAPTLTKWGAKTSTGREGWVESRHSPLSSRSFSVDRRAGTTNDDGAAPAAPIRATGSGEPPDGGSTGYPAGLTIMQGLADGR